MFKISAPMQSSERGTIENCVGIVAGIMLAVFSSPLIHAFGVAAVGFLGCLSVKGFRPWLRNSLFVLIFGIAGYAGFDKWRRDIAAVTPIQVKYQNPKDFSVWQRLTISNDLNDSYEKLAELGIPVSRWSPKIGAVSGNGTFSGMRLYDEGGFIGLGRDNPQGIDSVRLQYLIFLIERYVGVDKAMKYPDAQAIVAKYLNCSFKGALNEDCVRETGPLALLKLSQTYGKTWTDQVAAEALKSMHDDPTPPQFDDPLISASTVHIVSPKYLFYHLRDGELAMDADQSRMNRFTVILAEQGIKP